MRPLLIDNDAKKMVKEVLDYAKDNIIDINPENYLKIDPVGDNPSHVAFFQVGYRAVFSVERQRDRLFNHLSITVEGKDRYPNIAAANELLKLFGMHEVQSLKCTFQKVWIEKEPGAINILQMSCV